jgi:isopentenyl-diphosphate delta-isomerase
MDASQRRLMEELGISTFLVHSFYFEYRTEFENGLIEHELDHVLVGYTNENPILNASEAKAFQWISVENLLQDMRNSPEKYTIWFKIILNQHFEKIQKELCHARM